MMLKNDHGDVVGLTANGEVKADYTYLAYGELIADGSNGINNPICYAGEYTDEESGLIYLRARYYDPGLGRFISEDTHWNPFNMIYGDNPDEDNPVPNMSAIMQSNNLFVYCVNNPVMLMDPSGNVAYEHFSTMEEAAEDWAWNYYGVSEYIRMEQASLIFMAWDENGRPYYSYTYAVVGEPHSVDPMAAREYLPVGSIITGAVHSHPNSLNFSYDDYSFADNNNLTLFVAVPGFHESTTVKRYIEGEEPVDIVTIKYNQLDDFRKQELKARFAYQWLVHLEFGQCPEGADCHNRPWPGR